MSESRLVAALKRVPPLYLFLQFLYLHTVLRAQGSPRYAREQIWSALGKMARTAAKHGLRDGFLKAGGEFYLQMPDGLLLYYNYADRKLTMGDGQSLDLDSMDEADSVWQVIQKMLSPKDVYLDVGANNGYFYTLRVARMFPEVRVLAFEPNPQISLHLKHNVAVNGLANVNVIEKALGKESGSMFLAADLGASAFTAEKRGSKDWIEVPLAPLDDCLSDEQLRRVGVVKVDIEGGEYGFLQGCQRLMEQGRAIFILEHKEKWLARAGVSNAELQALVVSRGYDLFKFRDREEILVFPQSAGKAIEPLSGWLSEF